MKGLGSESSPFDTIQFGLDTCAERAECSAVVLRGGTHYLPETIVVTPKHSHTKLMAYPGEPAVVSGGIKVNAEFKPYGPAPAPASDEYTITQGDNAVWGGQINNRTNFLLGKFDNVNDCLNAANASNFDVFTYHDTTVEPEYVVVIGADD